MNEEMLDILIGKFLDSEITPAERRLLDEELDVNANSRRLFETMLRLHEQSRAVVNGAAQGGRSPAEVFEAAWEQSGGGSIRRRLGGWRRFAAGLAAGLAIGAGAFAFIMRGGAGCADGAKGGEMAAVVESGDALAQVLPLESDAAAAIDESVIREVDLYNFTDESGGRWLVEGLRERRVRPAIYYQDL